MVFLSGKQTPFLAPISMLMFARTIRPDMDISSTTGPVNSTDM